MKSNQLGVTKYETQVKAALIGVQSRLGAPMKIANAVMFLVSLIADAR